MNTRADMSAIRGRSSASLHAVTLIVFLAASSVPTPLYRLYQLAWGFSSLTLTIIFAVYAFGLLAALLLFGALSDRTGRRPVILGALALEIAPVFLFLFAKNVGWLLTARLIQGFATGLATTALSATLLDIDHEHGALVSSIATMAGTGLGALSSSLLARFAPAPLHFGFDILLAILLVQLTRTACSHETSVSKSKDGWRLRLRISVPVQARAALLAVSPLNIALWALGGFYLALMPSLMAALAGAAAAWVSGLAVAALSASAALTILVVRRKSASFALATGSLMLMAGGSGIVAGANLASLVLLVAGSVLAGIGLGAGFLGVLRSVMPLAAPQERAGLMSSFYIESYLAYAIPAVAAGYLAEKIGLLTTANSLGAAIICLAATALVLAIRLMRHQRENLVG